MSFHGFHFQDQYGVASTQFEKPLPPVTVVCFSYEFQGELTENKTVYVVLTFGVAAVGEIEAESHTANTLVVARAKPSRASGIDCRSLFFIFL